MDDVKKALEILELNVDASFREVTESHRDLTDVWNPERFPNNPRLRKKAKENLKAIDVAFELLRDHQLHAHTDQNTLKLDSPSATLSSSAPVGSNRISDLPTISSSTDDSASKAVSLFEEVFLDRMAPARRNIPIWFIPVPIFLLLMVIIYLVTPLEKEKKELFELPQVSKQSSTSDEFTSELPDDVETEVNVLNLPHNLKKTKKDTQDMAVAKVITINKRNTPSNLNPAPKISTVTTKNVASLSDKPILKRGDFSIEKDERTIDFQSVKPARDDSSKRAFQMLKEKSAVVNRLVEGKTVVDLKYQEWKIVRRKGSIFWIDLIAFTSGNRTELHLIWQVNTDTGTVTPLSQAARDLRSRLLTSQDS